MLVHSPNSAGRYNGGREILRTLPAGATAVNANPANPIIETICDEQARGHIVARAKPLLPGRFQLDFADGSVRQYDLPAGTTA